MILFVDQTGELGGAELSLLDLAVGFKDECSVFLFNDGPFRERLETKGVRVTVARFEGRDGERGLEIRRHSGLRDAIVALGGLSRLVRKVVILSKDADIIYPNTQKSAVVCFLAGLITSKPVVWHLRDILTNSHFSRFNRRVVVTLSNLFGSHVIANSAATMAAYRAAGGRCAGTVVWNGLHPTAFALGDIPAPVWRSRLGLAEAPTVAIFGRIAEWKGQSVFVDAIGQSSGVQGMIVGDPLFAGDEDYAKSIRDQVASCGLTERVHFFGFREDVAQLMAASDIVVHASIDPEPFGRVIIEAMLSRRPVIATRGGGATELVGVNDERGLLTAPGDPTRLACAIRSTLCGASETSQRVSRAFAFARENCGMDAVIAKVHLILEQVAKFRSRV